VDAQKVRAMQKESLINMKKGIVFATLVIKTDGQRFKDTQVASPKSLVDKKQ